MVLKKHHKIILGSFSTVVVLFMVVTAILLNGIIINQKLEINKLENKIDELQAITNNKINQISENVMNTQNNLLNLDESLNTKISLLKSSVKEDFSEVVENSVNNPQTKVWGVLVNPILFPML